MVFAGSPKNRWHLVALSDAMTHGKGFLIVASVLPKDKIADDRIEPMKESLRGFLTRNRVPALVEVTKAADTYDGIENLMRHYGLGPVVPNTFVMGVTAVEERIPRIIELIYLARNTGRNLILVGGQEDDEGMDHSDMNGSTIHLWQGRDPATRGFLMAMAYMIQTSAEWRGSDLHLWSLASSIDQKVQTMENLKHFLSQSRLDASIHVEIELEKGSLFDQVPTHSKDADLVMMACRPPEPSESPANYEAYYRSILRKSAGLKYYGLVWAFEKVDFEEIFV